MGKLQAVATQGTLQGSSEPRQALPYYSCLNRYVYYLGVPCYNYGRMGLKTLF